MLLKQYTASILTLILATLCLVLTLLIPTKGNETPQERKETPVMKPRKEQPLSSWGPQDEAHYRKYRTTGEEYEPTTFKKRYPGNAY